MIRQLKIFIILCCGAVSFKAGAQLIVGNVAEIPLVKNVLLGKGIEYKNVNYTGDIISVGFFENGLDSKLKMDYGIILSSGMAVGAKGPNNTDKQSTTIEKNNGSALLDLYAVGTTYSSATLQFDFKPQTGEVVFNYIFASEEYIEFVDSNVSDIFGFFISGPGIIGEQNVALVPGKTLPVSIDNINHLRNSQFFNNNPAGEKTLQADGYTTILTATLKLQPCEFYTIKLAIADVGDALLDSYVFIEGGSFQHKTGLGRDTFICYENFDIELDAGNPGRKVEWFKDGQPLNDTNQKIMVNNFGTYEVKVTTDCGSFIDTKKILPGIKAISLGKDTLYCGDSLLRKLKINSFFDSYLWSDGSKADTLVAKAPGSYWLEVNRDGCKKRDTINLILEPRPKINLGKDTIICGAINLTLKPAETALKYLWNTKDTTYSITVTRPGTYALQSFTKCPNSDAITIQQRNELNFDLGPARDICENDTISLKTGLRDTLNYSTVWNTGATTHTIYVSQSGPYKVSVRDKLCNFTATDSTFINVYEGAGSIWLPNAFTPGTDELNNTFKPVSDIKNFNHYNFLVFDRWGQKLYETTNPEVGWNGFFQNKLCENGVYIWSLNVKSNCSKGDKNFQRGIVHLIR